MDSTSLGPPSQRPPPIYVPGIKNIEELRQTLKSLVGATNETIIYAANADTYRTIVHKLRSSDVPFHCYQLKEDKSLRVVVRGLHHTSSIEEIKSEIKDHGIEVRNIVNALHLRSLPGPSPSQL
jgi:NAD+--asparagine ADP-ribosyltransferase